MKRFWMPVASAAGALCLWASADAAAAQVVVLVNEDTGGCVYKYDRPDAYAQAAAEAQSSWGHAGHKLLATNRAGFGAVFGVRNSRTGKVQFFARSGSDNLTQVINDTKQDAITYVRQNGLTDTVFICGNWNNTGRYPLDSYPTYGEF